DVYHITNEWIGVYAKYNKPSIVTFHDVFLKGPGSEYAKKMSSAPRLITKKFEWSKLYHWFGDRSKKASKFADLIICNSEFTRRNVVEALGVEERKIKRAFGIMSDCFKPRDKIRAREMLELPLDGKILLSIGSEDTPVKNIPTVVKAFYELQREVTKGLLVRVGSSSRETLSLIKKLGIERKVLHVRGLSEEGLAHLYNASDVLCFPVLYAGFGLPVAEAMASGLPVITSNCAALPEIVGDAGLLVDPFDVDQIASALKTALTDEKLRSELVNKGLERAKNFSLDKWGKETLKVYEEVLENA
ncbi:MAG: hypothetical protein DRJ03_15330, partial [Chloroflexi bacterium]